MYNDIIKQSMKSATVEFNMKILPLCAKISSNDHSLECIKVW